MLLINGEEMHPDREVAKTPYIHYHYVAFGQRSGVHDAFISAGENWKLEIDELASEIAERGVDPRMDLLPYAEGVWKLRKAREFGGLTVFAHPYWDFENTINLDIGAIEQTFFDGEVDAVEALSRADESSYMANRLIDANPTIREMPVVGVSDSHNWGPGMVPEYCTLVMAESLELEAFKDAIRRQRSVACRLSDPPVFVGPFEVVDFAGFYLNTMLPLRRRIMSLQGHIAMSGLRNGTFMQEMIDELDRELSNLDEKLWAKE